MEKASGSWSKILVQVSALSRCMVTPEIFTEGPGAIDLGVQTLGDK